MMNEVSRHPFVRLAHRTSNAHMDVHAHGRGRPRGAPHGAGAAGVPHQQRGTAVANSAWTDSTVP